jgi:hypothetical protein
MARMPTARIGALRAYGIVSPPRSPSILDWGMGLSGDLHGGAWPAPVLDLTRNRVLPNSPHPSLGGGRAERPGSESGSAQGGVGLPRPQVIRMASGALLA